MKAIVRPLIAFVFTLVQSSLGLWWVADAGAEAPFVALAPFTMMAMTFWFRARDEEKANAQG